MSQKHKLIYSTTAAVGTALCIFTAVPNESDVITLYFAAVASAMVAGVFHMLAEVVMGKDDE